MTDILYSLPAGVYLDLSSSGQLGAFRAFLCRLVCSPAFASRVFGKMSVESPEVGIHTRLFSHHFYLFSAFDPGKEAATIILRFVPR